MGGETIKGGKTRRKGKVESPDQKGSHEKGGRDLGYLKDNNPPNKLEANELATLLEAFGMPMDSSAFVLGVKQRPDWRVSGRVCFYDICFRLGLRFPLHPFLLDVFRVLKICPAQLLPNGWRLLLGLISLSDLNGIEISAETLFYSYIPQWYSPKTEAGRLAFVCRPHTNKLVILPPMKFDDNDPWKERYCFVKRKVVYGDLYTEEFATEWTFDGKHRKIKASKRSAVAESVQKLEGVLDKFRRWDYLLHPKQLVKTSLWESLVSESGSEARCLKDYMDRLKLIKLPSVKILGRVDEGAKKRKRGSSKAGTEVSDSVMVPEEVGESSSKLPSSGRVGRLHSDEPEGRFVTLKLREDACLHSDKRGLCGEEEKFLLPKDVIAMEKMGIHEFGADLVANALRTFQDSLYARKQLEDFAATQLSLKNDVKRLEKELEKERANSKASKELAEKAEAEVKEVLDGVDGLLKKGVAQTTLVMLKEYEKGMHARWKVREQIDECMAVLGEEATKVLEEFENEFKKWEGSEKEVESGDGSKEEASGEH